MTRTRWIAGLCAAALLVPFAGRADEKTAEKPESPKPPAESAAPLPAKPEPGKAPAKAEEKPAEKLDPAVAKAAEKAVRDYVAESSKEDDGKFAIDDPIEETLWMTDLEKLDAAAARKVSDAKVIVRGLFKQKADTTLARKAAAIELDLTLEKEGDKWLVTDEAIYTLDGKARFSYAPDHKRVPIPGLTDPEAPESDMEGELGEDEPGMSPMPEEDIPGGAEDEG